MAFLSMTSQQMKCILLRSHADTVSSYNNFFCVDFMAVFSARASSYLVTQHLVLMHCCTDLGQYSGTLKSSICGGYSKGLETFCLKKKLLQQAGICKQHHLMTRKLVRGKLENFQNHRLQELLWLPAERCAPILEQ